MVYGSAAASLFLWNSVISVGNRASETSQLEIMMIAIRAPTTMQGTREVKNTGMKPTVMMSAFRRSCLPQQLAVPLHEVNGEIDRNPQRQGYRTAKGMS